MAYDPFAPAENTEAPAVTEAPAPVAAAGAGEQKVVLTFKEGTGYDASWVVLHANTVAEADALLDDAFAALLQKTKKVAGYFRGQPNQAAAPAAPAQAAPAGAAAPPAGSPECPPGWEYKSGMTKAGKPYQAYFPPRGSNEKPIWL